MVAMATEHVIDVQHWNDTLFSFRTTRDPGFRFDSGQFVMMGLEADGRPLPASCRLLPRSGPAMYR